MIASRIRSGILCGLLGLLALPAAAQDAPPIQTPAFESPAVQTAPAASQPPAVQTPVDGRDASFLPTPLVPESNAVPVAMPANPVADTTTAVPIAPDTITKPVEISQPVESVALKGIDPDSIGLLTTENGGLGAAMWKGTPQELVLRLLPALTLPTPSAALNGLAQRFFLTTANVPEGANSGPETLTAMRVEKLVALGDTVDAWHLAILKPERIDETTLRLTVEAALVSSEGKNVCAKLPDIIHSHTSPEWQKSLIACQLRGGDAKGAQLGLEVLHTDDVKDDVFFELAEHNIVGGSKSLPRQLTPLKPLSLALLHVLDEPLPPELYAHPDAAAIPELLQAKARDESARLGLAERSAARSLISGAQLASAYRATTFTAEQLANGLGGTETGARERALLYQVALTEKTPQKRITEIIKFLQSLDTTPLNGVTAGILADMMSDIPIANDYNDEASDIVRVYIMAGKTKEALAWLKFARQSAASVQAIAMQLQNFWPLVVLAGIETDSDYGTTLHSWLDSALKDADHARREQIGSLLLLFEAAGFAVPEDAWARVVDTAAAERRAIPPSTLLLERLRAAGNTNHRGETVLLSLALAGTAAPNEPSLLTEIETVRALRLVGLGTDALMLAREAVTALLAPPQTTAKP